MFLNLRASKVSQPPWEGGRREDGSSQETPCSGSSQEAPATVHRTFHLYTRVDHVSNPGAIPQPRVPQPHVAIPCLWQIALGWCISWLFEEHDVSWIDMYPRKISNIRAKETLGTRAWLVFLLMRKMKKNRACLRMPDSLSSFTFCSFWSLVSICSFLPLYPSKVLDASRSTFLLTPTD